MPKSITTLKQLDNTSNSSDFVIFTDKNDFFQLEIPGDREHATGTGDPFYVDSFVAPDGQAAIDGIVYDDGDPFPGGTNYKFALGLLQRIYSVAGKEGDIHITDDRMERDGTERFACYSEEGGNSGISYFEVRNRTISLISTMVFNNDYENPYLDTSNYVISTCDVPWYLHWEKYRAGMRQTNIIKAWM